MFTYYSDCVDAYKYIRIYIGPLFFFFFNFFTSSLRFFRKNNTVFLWLCILLLLLLLYTHVRILLFQVTFESGESDRVPCRRTLYFVLLLCTPRRRYVSAPHGRGGRAMRFIQPQILRPSTRHAELTTYMLYLFSPSPHTHTHIYMLL